MINLYLMRHAKAESLDTIFDDFQRGITTRGKNDIEIMTKRLLEFKVSFDLIISSDAKRAKKTAKRVAKALNYNTQNIMYKSSLYDASLNEYHYALEEVDFSKYKNILFIGHNPTITAFAESLSDAICTSMPTSSIIAIKYDECKKVGDISFFDFPKKHYID